MFEVYPLSVKVPIKKPDAVARSATSRIVIIIVLVLAI